MNIEVIADEAGLARLWAPLGALWRRIPEALPFLAPEWLRPWWAVFGTGRPVVAVLHAADGLAGALPLYRLEDKLLPMGVGISDYFDVLLAPDAPAVAMDALLAAALEAGGAARCDLPDLPEGARLRFAAAPAGWRAETWDGEPCPVLPLVPEPMVPKGMRRDLRQARNRAERGGGWEVQRADPGCLAGLLDALARLHQQRWQGRGEPGVMADARVPAFHRAAAPGLLAAGLLRLEVVRLRGAVAAAVYGLLGERRIYFYLCGFDSAFKFESPGTLLLGHMIETAAQEGRHETHFLRGGEAYKHRWGAVDRPNEGRSFLRT